MQEQGQVCGCSRHCFREACPEVSDLPLSRRPGSLTHKFAFGWFDFVCFLFTLFVFETGSHYIALDGPEIAM